MSRVPPCVDDATIEAAIVASGLMPEFFEWHGDRFVTLRLQVEGSRWYAEGLVEPGMEIDDVVAVIDRLARGLDVTP